MSTTLRHGDTGWKHYADAWRVADESGKVLGKRVLLHPHETEQPFTRGVSGMRVPDGVTTVYVEAHGKVRGRNPERVRVDLNHSRGERFSVKRQR